MISKQYGSLPHRVVRPGWVVTILMVSPLFCVAGQAAAGPLGEKPDTFLWNASSLVAAKAAQQDGAPMVVADVRGLIDEANEALSAPPVSVAVDKVRTAASGDPHDYFSVAPYWWPDPATSDGLPWVQRDGKVNPDNDADRLKLDALVKAVRRLALAWYFTGEERYAEHAVAFLRTWFVAPDTRMNPHLRYSQAIPGTTDGRSTGMIDTVFLRDLVDGIRLLQGSSSLTAADESALRGWFSDYLDWFLTSEFGREEAATKNNHATWYYAQIGLYAAFTGREADVRPVYEERLPVLAQQQFGPDGSQPFEIRRTRSMHYSAYNLTAWEDIVVLGRRMGLDYYRDSDPVGERIQAGLHYLARYTPGDSEWPHPEIRASPERYRLFPVFIRAIGLEGDETIETALGQAIVPNGAGFLRLVYGSPNSDK